MKSLNKYITKGLRIAINDSPYVVSPTSWNELRRIVKERFKELGPGTAKEPIYFGDINVSEMTTFYDGVGIFEDTKFKYIDVSEWDVSNIKDMSCMFLNCINIKSIGDISNWDVSNVENMSWMFVHCTKLKQIGDISNWNILNVKAMTSMFNDSGIINIPDWYVK